MKKCDPRAWAACAYKSDCGPLGEAQFADGSECEQFNEEIINRPRTNADRIRSMSDEELVEFIIGGTERDDFYIEGADWLVKDELLQWLQQPAEEGGGGDVSHG